MKCKVYLNESRDSFFGFANKFSDPELVLSHEFEMEDRLAYANGQTASPDGLHIIFWQLNVDQPTESWSLEWRVKKLRSLSVGDVVVLGESAWACESIGWRKISAQELLDAIVKETVK